MNSTRILYLFITIITFSNICYGVAVIEDQCLKNIAQKFQDPGLNVPNIVSTFCSLKINNCFVNGSVQQLILNPKNTIELSNSDISCFSNLEVFVANNATVNQTLLTTPFDSIKSFILISNNLLSVDFEIAPFPFITLSDTEKRTLTFSNYALKNLENFYSDSYVNFFEGSHVGYKNNVTKTLNIYSINIPDLTNMIKVDTLTLNIGYSTLNETSYVNFKIFPANVKRITINGYGTYRFPSEIGSISTPLDKLSFSVDGFTAPSSPIDFSNIPNIGSFSISKMGENFSYQGNFPFSKLPLKCISVLFQNGNISNIDWELFKNITSVSIRNLQLVTPLPSKNPFITPFLVLDISNNNITGTLDDSWCSANININNNQFSGKIPNCFYCYLDIATIGNNFALNNFSNYKTVNNTCGYDLIVPYIIKDRASSSLTLNGKNLGFSSNNIKTSTCIIFYSGSGVFSLNVCAGTYVNITIINQNLNFTLSLDNTVPKIDRVAQSNNTLTISGSYFSYEPSIMNITIGTTPLKCQVSNSSSTPSFYEIQCDIQYPIIEYGPRNVTVQVNSLVSKPYEIYLNYSKAKCPDCNGNGICNDHSGKCECFNNWISIGQNICTVPNHYLSAYTQVSDAENGGILYLYGFFGDTHNGLKVLIDGSQCAIEVGPTSTTIVISVNPGTIGKNSSIEIYQNTLTFYGTIYPYLNPIKECPSNCNSHGKCNTTTGECTCQNGYTGVDCIAKTNSTLPSITSRISNGAVIFRSEQTVFTVSPYSFNEFDYKGNIININSINSWRIENTNQGAKFIGTSANNATFELTYLKVTQNQQFSFAGNEFTVDAGGIKMSITVSNYTYSNQSNFLVAALRANVESDLSVTQNKCNNGTTVFTSQSNSNVTLNNYNYFTISKDAKRLSIRVQDRLISDNQPTFMVNQLQTKLVDNSLVFGMTLPHCGKQCSIDGPDFIVNVEPNYKTASSCAPTSTTSSSENQPSSSIRESSISIILIIIPILISLSF
ncbi:hypothetical protein RB653_007627 [Dictyostelium firmibasis]|uniref:EGF-like domain-containing protein n=1 Tax=Dictyostelium firmibasis TaxID=79012 RepID=A0AAN7U455_9MYCE